MTSTTNKTQKIAVDKPTQQPETIEVKKEQPYGIDWFSEVTGETIYTHRSPSIKAFINSSVYSPNSHAGQDRGWKLGPIWHKKLSDSLNDSELSSLVDNFTDDEGNVKDYPGLIMALWNREVKLEARKNRLGAQGRPFADKYRKLIGQ